MLAKLWGIYPSLNTMHQQGFAAEHTTSAQGVRRLKERCSSNFRSIILFFPLDRNLPLYSQFVVS